MSLPRRRALPHRGEQLDRLAESGETRIGRQAFPVPREDLLRDDRDLEEPEGVIERHRPHRPARPCEISRPELRAREVPGERRHPEPERAERGMVTSLHPLDRGAVLLGWDVAITAGGAVLVEVNGTPGVDLWQLAAGRGFGDDQGQRLLAELDATPRRIQRRRCRRAGCVAGCACSTSTSTASPRRASTAAGCSRISWSSCSSRSRHRGCLWRRRRLWPTSLIRNT